MRLTPLVTCFLSVLTCAAAQPPRFWGAEAFQPITAERIAALPAAEQPAWRAYWQKSTELNQLVGARDFVDHSSTKRLDGPGIPSHYSKGVRLGAPAAWYASEEARTIADHVVNWQTPVGGWVKSGDYSRERKPADDQHDSWSAGTFDNDSTIYELRFLALVSAAATNDPALAPRVEAWRACFLRGLDYALAAQYPNGGFPQIFPLVGWYHDAVTFNDDAMVHILELCRDIGAQNAEFAFVPSDRAGLAHEALVRGTACILAAQLRSADGNRIIWPQQVDPLTLAPCAARNFEPISACSLESVGLIQFLMSIPQPAPEIVGAVDAAVAWYPAHALHGVVWSRTLTTGTGLVPREGAPDIWARFYEIGTNRPIFGDRDRSVHYAVSELSSERRLGYGWFNSRAAGLAAAHAAWQKQLVARK